MTPPKRRVEFRDVAFEYLFAGAGEEVLSGISFTAEPGEVVAIVGGTGCGKSSLVQLIPRLRDRPPALDRAERRRHHPDRGRRDHH